MDSANLSRDESLASVLAVSQARPPPPCAMRNLFASVGMQIKIYRPLEEFSTLGNGREGIQTKTRFNS